MGRGARWARVVSAALGLLAAGCAGGDDVDVPSEAGSTTTSAAAPTTVASVSVLEQATSYEGLLELELPAEGVAVSYRRNVEVGLGDGVLLVGIDGALLAAVPRAMVRSTTAPGPLVVRTDDGDLLLDPDRRKLTRVESSGEERLPLANGAGLVSMRNVDPGRSWLEQGGREVFDLGNGMEGPGSFVSYDRDVVSYGPAAFDTRARSKVRVPEGCFVADRHAERWLDLCGEPVPSEVRLRRRDDQEVAFPRPSEVGHWRSAMFSNDGRRVLLQWSAECEVPVAYVGAIGGQLTTLPWIGATSVALGWTKDDGGLVFVPTEPGCGSDDGRSGVHVVDADGTWVRVFGPPDGIRLVDASMWTPLPG